jgi:septal ring factor EnvC (AmiA/AmiB activator)
MTASFRVGLIPVLALALSACDGGQSQQMENELMLMQERLLELETQLADAQEHARRLGPAVRELEVYVGDVENEVIDLSMNVSRDLLVNVEANLGNVKTKVAEVRDRTALLSRSLETLEDEP